MQRLEGTFEGDGCVDYFGCGDFTSVYHVNSYQIVHFKYVQFILCQIYLNELVKNTVG